MATDVIHTLPLDRHEDPGQAQGALAMETPASNIAP
jgi:hypothetical protein